VIQEHLLWIRRHGFFSRGFCRFHRRFFALDGSGGRGGRGCLLRRCGILRTASYKANEEKRRGEKNKSISGMHVQFLNFMGVN
jgi:hypothetical protein